jgi:hypothetical protein
MRIGKIAQRSEAVLDYHFGKSVGLIMTKKVGYDCGKCPGYCCSYDYIETKSSDVKRLAKHHDLPLDEAREKFTKEVEHEGETIRVLRHRKAPLHDLRRPSASVSRLSKRQHVRLLQLHQIRAQTPG